MISANSLIAHGGGLYNPAVSIINKTLAKTFTLPAEKRMGTRWPFVKKINEKPAYSSYET